MTNRVGHGGEANDSRTMACAERSLLLTAAADWQLPQTIDAGRGKALSATFRAGRPGSTEYPHRAQSAPGGPYYEQELMRKQRFIGPCPEVLILTILEPKVALCGTECSW